MSTEAELDKKKRPLQYPETIISSRNSDQTIVTDVLIKQGTIFGPFPGTDAVEADYNNWMEYASCVKDFAESNLIIGFCNDELYFQAHRCIPAGTELLVWGGNKDNHSTNFTEWNKCKRTMKNKLTFTCLECNFVTQNMHTFMFHGNKLHKFRKAKEKNCKCFYCPHISTAKGNWRRHILRKHGIFIKTHPRKKYEKKKKGTIIEAQISTQQDKNVTIETKINPSTPTETESEPCSSTIETTVVNSDSANYTVSNGSESGIHKCIICGSIFDTAKSLSGHMGAHKRNRRRKPSSLTYKCGFCGRKFSTKPGRFKHINTVHRGKSFICSICKKGFTQSCNLRRHIKVIHKSQTHVIEKQIVNPTSDI